MYVQILYNMTFTFGLTESEAVDGELGVRCRVRLLRCSLRPRSSWDPESEARGPPTPCTS